MVTKLRHGGRIVCPVEDQGQNERVHRLTRVTKYVAAHDLWQVTSCDEVSIRRMPLGFAFRLPDTLKVAVEAPRKSAIECCRQLLSYRPCFVRSDWSLCTQWVDLLICFSCWLWSGYSLRATWTTSSECLSSG